ncbi:MAG: response regulator [Pseudobdellovibrio sp.]
MNNFVSSKHILIVDDSADLQVLLLQLFKSVGYKISQAYDGRQALNFLETSNPQPSVVLLDIMMPEMDGIELKSAMNRDSKLAGIPVIWMSADAGSLNKARALGGVDFIQKPIRDLDGLISKVENTQH